MPRETNKLTSPNKLCTYMKGNRRMQELCKSVREMTLEVCCWWWWWWLGGGGGGAGVVCAEFSRHSMGKALNQLWKNVGFVPLSHFELPLEFVHTSIRTGIALWTTTQFFLRLQKWKPVINFPPFLFISVQMVVALSCHFDVSAFPVLVVYLFCHL